VWKISKATPTNSKEPPATRTTATTEHKMRKNHETKMEEGRDRKEGKEEGKKERQRGCSDSVCLLAVKPKQCRSK